MKLKQNLFWTVLKLFCFSFVSTCGQFRGLCVRLRHRRLKSGETVSEESTRWSQRVRALCRIAFGLCGSARRTNRTLMCKSVYNNLSLSLRHTHTHTHTHTRAYSARGGAAVAAASAAAGRSKLSASPHLSVMTSAATHSIMTVVRRCDAYQCGAVITYTAQLMPASNHSCCSKLSAQGPAKHRNPRNPILHTRNSPGEWERRV